MPGVKQRFAFGCHHECRRKQCSEDIPCAGGFKYVQLRVCTIAQYSRFFIAGYVCIHAWMNVHIHSSTCLSWKLLTCVCALKTKLAWPSHSSESVLVQILKFFAKHSPIALTRSPEQRMFQIEGSSHEKVRWAQVDTLYTYMYISSSSRPYRV